MAEGTDSGTGGSDARGFVRESLATLRNLENLLRSPRIGPRALEPVVQELRTTSRPIGDAFEILSGRIARRGPLAELTPLLGDFARKRVTQLDASLNRAASSDMGAKARLSLESDVRRISVELDALRELIELLEASTRSSTTELDLNALVMESLTAMASVNAKNGDAIRVRFHPAPDHPTVVTDPRVIMPLISLGIAMIARKDDRTIEVTAASDSTRGIVIECAYAEGAEAATDCADAEGDDAPTACTPPLLITPTLPAALQAAREIGAVLVVDLQVHRICIQVHPPQVVPAVSCSRATLRY